MKQIVVLVLACVLWCCSYKNEGPTSGPARELTTGQPEDTTVIERDAFGLWILSEFHDSIAVHRRIGRYRRPTPVWGALALNVDSDTVRLAGTLGLNTPGYARAGRDTLLSVDLFAGPLTFIHDRRTDVVLVDWQNRSRAEHRGTMHYRRLRPDEHRVIEGAFSPARDHAWLFQQSYRAYLNELLFTGQYEPLDSDQHVFRIDAHGAITGHPQWNTFRFHSYFGTLHPFEHDLDGLIFEDRAGNWHAFNWRYAGDTLILRPMTTDEDIFHLAKGEFRFLKRM